MAPSNPEPAHADTQVRAVELQPRGSDVPMPGPPAEEPPPDAVEAPPGQTRNLLVEPEDDGDAALFLPRAILFIPRWTIWGIFWPFDKLLGVFDDAALARLRAVFFWNEEETAGWYPLLSFQTAYGFSVGARLFHDDVFGNDESISAEAEGGGLYSQAYQLRFVADRLGGSQVFIDMRGRYDVRPRLIFFGLGDPPGVDADDAQNLDPRRGGVRTRYSQQRGLAALRLGYAFGRPRRAFLPSLRFIYNHRRFGPDRSRTAWLFSGDDDPSIEEVYDVSRLTGFDSGVDVVHTYADVEIDFRNRRGDPSQGFYFRALGGGAPPQFRNVAFAHYGLELKTFIDLFDNSRILVLRGALDAVHGDDDAIPFSELPRLGGPHRLRGYRLNRFRDRRALLGTVEYRYPIHQYVGGYLFVDVGRVAPTYEELFDPRMDQWRTGYGGGFRFRSRRRHFFRIDFAYGKDFMVFFTTDAVQAFTDEHLLEL